MPDRDALAGLPEARQRVAAVVLNRAGSAGLTRLTRLPRLAWLTAGARCATGTASPACAACAGRSACPAVTAIAAVAAGSTLTTRAALAAVAAVAAGGIKVGRSADRRDVVDLGGTGHRRGGQRGHRRGENHASGCTEGRQMAGVSQHVARLAVSRRTTAATSHLLPPMSGLAPLFAYLHNVSSWVIWSLRFCRSGV
jgi:hypothetical protein